MTDLAWSAGSRRLYFQADVKGRTPLHEIDLAGGPVRVLSGVGTLDAFKIAADDRFAVLARRRVGEPWELYRLDLARPGDGAGTRITGHNAAVASEVDIRPAEEMWVEAADGARLQVFIVKPHGFDATRKYPLILNVHGGPQQQWTDALRGDWQVYPGAGYVVAFANPRGSTGFGQAFTAAISKDWNGKAMDDIARVTEAVAALPYVDAERLGAMGWSWGGYAMMWLEGHSTRFKALASMMGVYDLRAMYSAHRRARLPRALHAVARVLHRPPEDARAVAADRVRARRPLAVVARDGALLRRPSRLVPPVAGRRGGALGPEGDRGRRGGARTATRRALRRPALQRLRTLPAPLSPLGGRSSASIARRALRASSLRGASWSTLRYIAAARARSWAPR